MPVLADVKVIPETVATRDRLREGSSDGYRLSGEDFHAPGGVVIQS